ncbi:nitroreductase family protein [Methanocrinis sp.]|uniref:nitroreductase family protein n=1 Tax=Methanocrinis sp. TaxID=3101522 RepID=UPI003D103132
MNDIFRNIYGRRSIRKYLEDDVSDEEILDLIKAGVRAPSATNEQPWRFVIVKNRDLIARYSSRAKELWLKQYQGSEGPEAQGLIGMVSDPEFNIFYDAPVLVMIFGRLDAFAPEIDCALAAENMMLSAWSLGIGSCWIGLAVPLGEDEDFLKEVGAWDGYKLVAPLIFGHPAESDHEPTSRDEDVVLRWVK